MKAAERGHSYPGPWGLSQAGSSVSSGQPLPVNAFRSGAEKSTVPCGPGLHHSADSEDLLF